MTKQIEAALNSVDVVKQRELKSEIQIHSDSDPGMSQGMSLRSDFASSAESVIGYWLTRSLSGGLAASKLPLSTNLGATCSVNELL
jgi:hypothetical protein